MVRTIPFLRYWFVAVVLWSSSTDAHDLHPHTGHSHEWHKSNGDGLLHGSFHHVLGTTVFIEDDHDVLWAVPIQELSIADRHYVEDRQAYIEELNHPAAMERGVPHGGKRAALFLQLGILVLVIVGFLFWRGRRSFVVLSYALIGSVLMGFGGHALRATRSLTDPLRVDSAFSPFKPKVNTHWDDDWFYVESLGLAQHEMMTGITSWQQQVPIPQCYTGTNAWQIPLNPALADTAIPVDSIHFTRGAVAVAVNGIPIFNPHTNTGVDAFLDGQLDVYGGHSGRADDYHYHIAPLHLYQQTLPTRPIAFALDGYAVYGAQEPEGTPMQPLDTNHGHFGQDGVYHYHGTAGAPYMIGNMVGQVTEDTTHQLIPQPHAHPVRPALTPLQGATIISHTPNADTTGYTLIYVRNGQTDSVVYSWTSTGVYTYEFHVNGVMTTQTYNGPAPCAISTLLEDVEAQEFVVFPSPTHSGSWIRFTSAVVAAQVRGVSVFDPNGREVRNFGSVVPYLDLSDLPSGTYIVRVKMRDRSFTRRVVLF